MSGKMLDIEQPCSKCNTIMNIVGKNFKGRPNVLFECGECTNKEEVPLGSVRTSN